MFVYIWYVKRKRSQSDRANPLKGAERDSQKKEENSQWLHQEARKHARTRSCRYKHQYSSNRCPLTTLRQLVSKHCVAIFYLGLEEACCVEASVYIWISTQKHTHTCTITNAQSRATLISIFPLLRKRQWKCIMADAGSTNASDAWGRKCAGLSGGGGRVGIARCGGFSFPSSLCSSFFAVPPARLIAATLSVISLVFFCCCGL